MTCSNAAATAQNILASERLFRLGVVSELVCAVQFIFVLWVLYQLLAAVNKTRFCIATSTLSAGSLALAFLFRAACI
jgi:hypothetical protein